MPLVMDKSKLLTVQSILKCPEKSHLDLKFGFSVIPIRELEQSSDARLGNNDSGLRTYD